jgi:hypothetical protein
MAHRAEDGQAPGQVTVRLPDLEPFAGLIAATSRFCAYLTPAAYEAMPEKATDALEQVQAIMWRLEHAQPEPDPPEEK